MQKGSFCFILAYEKCKDFIDSNTRRKIEQKQAKQKTRFLTIS